MTGPPIGRPRDPAVDDAVLDAMLALLVDRDPALVSLQMVADLAGVAKATIYRRWPSKGAVVVAAVTRLLERGEPIAETGHTREDLIRRCEAQLASYRTGAGQWTVSVVASERRHPEMRPAVASLVQAQRVPFRRIVEAGIASGDLAADVDVDVAVELITGAILSRLLTDDGRDAGFAAALVNQVLRGLLTRPAA